MSPSGNKSGNQTNHSQTHMRFLSQVQAAMNLRLTHLPHLLCLLGKSEAEICLKLAEDKS